MCTRHVTYWTPGAGWGNAALLLGKTAGANSNGGSLCEGPSSMRLIGRLFPARRYFKLHNHWTYVTCEKTYIWRGVWCEQNDALHIPCGCEAKICRVVHGAKHPTAFIMPGLSFAHRPSWFIARILHVVAPR